ncbi:MAG: UDP-3-O-(3-hydroxymyristoyl)glucosamine N-acyltransferase [Bdellovibrionales bacterium]
MTTATPTANTANSASAMQIVKAFSELVQPLDGVQERKALCASSQDSPKHESIVYIAEEKYLSATLKSQCSIIVVHKKISEKAKELNNGQKTLLVTSNTYLAMALINARFFSLNFKKKPFGDGPLIHSTAVLDKTVELGADVVIGPGAVLSKNVKIGARTYIGANTVIEAHTRIGEDCYIHAQVQIGHTCVIGNRVEIKSHSVIGSDGFGFAHDNVGKHYHIPHYGSIIVEDDVYIGANVNIDRGTFDSAIVGSGTKIDNHCHFGHNCKIGKNCIITAGIIVAGSSTIGSNCVFAGRVSVNGHISICDNCSFGPLSAITNDVLKPGIYAGYPIIPIRDSLKVQASLEHLPMIRKNLSRVLKHLGLNKEDGA